MPKLSQEEIYDKFSDLIVNKFGYKKDFERLGGPGAVETLFFSGAILGRDGTAIEGSTGRNQKERVNTFGKRFLSGEEFYVYTKGEEYPRKVKFNKETREFEVGEPFNQRISEKKMPKKPNVFDRIADSVLKLFGSRSGRCEIYEEFENYYRMMDKFTAPEQVKSRRENDELLRERAAKKPEANVQRTNTAVRQNTVQRTVPQTEHSAVQPVIQQRDSVLQLKPQAVESSGFTIRGESEKQHDAVTLSDELNPYETLCRKIYGEIEEKFGKECLTENLKDNINLLVAGNVLATQEVEDRILRGEEKFQLGVNHTANIAAYNQLLDGVKNGDYMMMADLQNRNEAHRMQERATMSPDVKYVGGRTHTAEFYSRTIDSEERLEMLRESVKETNSLLNEKAFGKDVMDEVNAVRGQNAEMIKNANGNTQQINEDFKLSPYAYTFGKSLYMEPGDTCWKAIPGSDPEKVEDEILSAEDALKQLSSQKMRTEKTVTEKNLEQNQANKAAKPGEIKHSEVKPAEVKPAEINIIMK